MSRYCTPLRYPGGKQRIAHFFREIMQESNLVGGHYVEPFAGGAGIAIDLLLDGTASHIYLNDLSKPVYSFWRAILREPDAFCRRISRSSLTVEEWRRQRAVLLSPSGHSQLDVGYSLFYLNRCNRSGIPTGGLIGGLKQTGEWRMNARFPRKELIRRIEVIAAHRKSITVKNLDAVEFLTVVVPKLPADTLVYCDPPYYQNADRLYLNFYKDEHHSMLAETIQLQKKHRWAVSYDAVPEIEKHYRRFRSFRYELQYNAARAYKGKEVLFFSNSVQIPQKSRVSSINAALQMLRSARPKCKSTSR